MENEFKEMKCILDGCHGIYIPQQFVTTFTGWQGISLEDETICAAGPDHEYYWDAWDAILSRATYTDENGQEWFLWQDGDLFACRQ